MSHAKSLTQAGVCSRDGRGRISKTGVSLWHSSAVSTPGPGAPAPEKPQRTYNGGLLILSVQCHDIREAALYVISLRIVIASLVFSLNDLRNGPGLLLH